MRRPAMLLAMLWSPLVLAGVVNVEFNFTPYAGDLKQDKVETVPGKVRVYLNSALVAEQEVRKDSLPVLFDDRQIAPSLWMPASSFGPALRKRHNLLRIEFEPTDPKASYTGQVSWAMVTDQTTETDDGAGTTTSTNQAGEGKEDRPVTGKLVFERYFDADFAADRPWHHYPALASLSEADKAQLAALVAGRSAGFKPDFAPVYALLDGHSQLHLEEIRKHKCVDAAYAAGIRVKPMPLEQIDFALSGGPEVVVQGRAGALYDFGDKAVFEKIKGDDMQMCAGVVLSLAYPQRMAVVRNPAGAWEVVY